MRLVVALLGLLLAMPGLAEARPAGHHASIHRVQGRHKHRKHRRHHKHGRRKHRRHHRRASPEF